MNRKIVFFVTFFILVIFAWFGLKTNSSQDLVGSNLLLESKQTPSPSPLPSATPKTFKYDRATNLKEELDKINPQILDTDFED